MMGCLWIMNLNAVDENLDLSEFRTSDCEVRLDSEWGSLFDINARDVFQEFLDRTHRCQFDFIPSDYCYAP